MSPVLDATVPPPDLTDAQESLFSLGSMTECGPAWGPAGPPGGLAMFGNMRPCGSPPAADARPTAGPPLVFTGLGPPESPVRHNPDSSEIEVVPGWPDLVHTFRHAGWADRRARRYAALVASGASPSALYAFAKCGSSFWMLRSKEDRQTFKAVPDCCHSRWCDPCTNARASIIRANMLERCAEGHRRHLTLTLKANAAELGDQIDRLYKAFRTLRSRPWWKDRVTGGAACFELTYNPETGFYHPHLHCILEGRYIGKETISRDWLTITGDSWNTRIDYIRDRAKAVGYVIKYVTKPISKTVSATPELLTDVMRALAHRRLLLTFGTWNKYRLTSDPTEKAWDLFCHAWELLLSRHDAWGEKAQVLKAWNARDDASEPFTVLFEHPPPEEGD